jgi:hypothetical protein
MEKKSNFMDCCCGFKNQSPENFSKNNVEDMMKECMNKMKSSFSNKDQSNDDSSMMKDMMEMMQKCMDKNYSAGS